MVEVIGLSRFESLFRKVASLDVDKQDIKRMNELINQKIVDLIILAEAAARSNGRDIIQYYDLPITKGIQEHINEFKKYDYHLELSPLLGRVTTIPQLNSTCSKEIEDSIANIAGSLTIMLAKIFKVIDPDLKNPVTDDWNKIYKIFNIML
jgi:hypothetical protein